MPMGYGNDQAMYTMNRAAYGDVPAAMMGAGVAYGGAASGLQNMMADVGSAVMPVMYTPPARSMVGFYGTYQQPTGFLRSGAAAMGFTTVPRGTSALDYQHSAAGDFGERLGGGIVGAGVTGMSMLAGAALNVSGAGSLAGSAAGSLVGASGIGGFLGGIAAPVAFGAYTAGAVTKAVEERRQISTFLEQSSFRFTGSGSSMSDPVTGVGMSRGARQEMGEFIRGMDIRDKTLNMGDLSQVLKQGTQLGMFNGTRDMEDFQRKFKEITEAVKTVTKTLHQTLEDGMKTLADLKGVGIDPSQARMIVTQSDTLGKVAGRTGQEMIGLGLQGAEMFRGTGVTMGIGFQSSQMNLASIRASRDFGTLSQEAISQAGGEEALALRMSAGGLSFAQSAMGRGFGASMFKAGAPGGGLNVQSFMQNMMTGGGDFLHNIQAGAQNISSPAKLIEFQANQEKFTSAMGQQFGGRGLEMAMLGATAGYAEYLSKSTGASKEDAFRLSLKQQGKSQSEIDAYMAQIKDPDKIFKSMQQGIEATGNKMKLDEASENFVLNRLGSAIGDQTKRVIDLAAKPLNEVIDDVAAGVQKFSREQIYGAIQGTARGVDLNVKFDMTDKERQAMERGVGVTDMNQGAMFAKSSGEQLAGALEDTKGLGALTGIYTNVQGDAGNVTADQLILKNNRMFGAIGPNMGVTTVDRDVLEKGMQRAKVLGMTDAEAKRFQDSGKLANVKGEGLLGLFASGKAGGLQTGQDILTAMFGADSVAKGITAEQMAFAITETKGTGLEKILNETRVGAQKLMDGSSNAKILDLKNARSMYDEGKSALERTGDIKLADGVPELLAKANEASKSNNPESERSFLAQAKALQAKKTGASLGDIDRGIMSAYSGNQSALENIKMGVVKMQGIQQQRGSSALSSAIESALYTEEGVKLDDTTRTSISTAATALGSGRIEDIRDVLGDKDLTKALGQVGPGKAVVTQLQSILNIEDKLGGAKNDKERRDILKGTFKDEKQLGEMIKLASTEGKSAVVDEALKSFQQNMASQGGIASASGQGSTSGDPNAQNAGQMAQTQTSINLQVLSAMQGLAKKVGVQ